MAPPFPFSKTTLSLYPLNFVEQREETFPYSIIFEGKFAGMQTISLKILPCYDGEVHSVFDNNHFLTGTLGSMRIQGCGAVVPMMYYI